jgi:hypothetical protein
LARYVGSLDVNAEQVKRGMAWVYRKYARDQALFALEQEAKSAKRGLWADPHAIPPWESRHGGRANPPAESKSAQALGKASGNHQCGAKRYCNQMASCEEARLYLTQCGLRRLDSDGDGGRVSPCVVEVLVACPKPCEPQAPIGAILRRPAVD